MNQNYIVQIVLRGADILASGASYESFLLVNNCDEMTKATSFPKNSHKQPPFTQVLPNLDAKKIPRISKIMR